MASFILISTGVYASIGVVFAIRFAFAGAGRLDPVARHAPLAFRLVIMPGAVALWPWLLCAWLGRGKVETRP